MTQRPLTIPNFSGAHADRDLALSLLEVLVASLAAQGLLPAIKPDWVRMVRLVFDSKTNEGETFYGEVPIDKAAAVIYPNKDGAEAESIIRAQLGILPTGVFAAYEEADFALSALLGARPAAEHPASPMSEVGVRKAAALQALCRLWQVGGPGLRTDVEDAMACVLVAPYPQDLADRPLLVAQLNENTPLEPAERYALMQVLESKCLAVLAQRRAALGALPFLGRN